MTSIQIFGIIAGILLSAFGLFLNAFAIFKSLRSRKLTNYQEITKSHREIWKMSIDTPEKFERIFSTDANLVENPLNEVERRYIQLVLLHMTSTFNFSKESELMEIENLKYDFDYFLSFPLPRKVWTDSKHFYNKSFTQFIESPPETKLSLIEKFYNTAPKRRAIKSKKWTVLVLSTTPDPILKEIHKLGDSVLLIADQNQEVNSEFIIENNIDIIVCFGYSKIFKADILKMVEIINIHFSLLPLHRGPNPNLWAWLKDTKKGVSLHYINEGIDKGDLISQKEVVMDDSYSLQSSYDKLTQVAIEMFAESWPLIRMKTNKRTPQVGTSSYHTMSDQSNITPLFNEGGVDLPIKDFVAKANELIDEKLDLPQIEIIPAENTGHNNRAC